MRVALYYPWIYLTSGAERTLIKLTEHSRHDWTLFTNRFEPASTFLEFRHRDVVELERVSVERTLAATARSALRIAAQKLPLDGFDALVVVCEGLGDLAVFRNRDLPLLNLCLTPLRIAFDPAYRARYEEGAGPLRRLALRLGAAAFRALNRFAWRRYDRVFFISEESRRRAAAGRLGRPEIQDVLHVGIGVEPHSHETLYERYFLLPGRIMWTKNVELGVQAFQQAVQAPGCEDFRLVVAGIVDLKSRPYLERLRALAGGDPRIEFRVFPSDAELEELYRRCYAVLFPAFNEDWGIVPVEAMAFGKPVVAVNRGGPRESVQDGVQGFLEEPVPAAFARRMVELARDEGLTRRLGQAGKDRAKRYSWSAFAERIDEELERLAASRRASRPETLSERALAKCVETTE